MSSKRTKMPTPAPRAISRTTPRGPSGLSGGASAKKLVSNTSTPPNDSCKTQNNPLSPREQTITNEIAYSTYLQALFFEKLMTKVSKDADVNIQLLLGGLHEDHTERLRSITSLRQRIIEIKTLVEEETLLDPLSSQLEILLNEIEEPNANICKLSESLKMVEKQLHAKNLVLPITQKEHESMVETLITVSGNLQDLDVSEQCAPYSDASQLLVQLEESKALATNRMNNCQKILPNAAKHLIQCYSLQSSINPIENGSTESTG